MAEEELQLSKFNAGLLQMKRIHELQDTINKCNLNLLNYNENIGSYNYEIILSCLDSLYQEAKPKLKPDEIKNCETKRRVINEFLKRKPLMSMKKTQVPNGKGQLQVDTIVWNLVKEQLFEYESLVRDCLDKHDLNSPGKDDLSGL